MKQLLRSMFDTLTYRNEYTDPDPADGLQVSDQQGKRTVHDPAVPRYLNARRERIVRDGCDEDDLMLIDADTVALLKRTRHAVARRSRPRTPDALVPERTAP